MHTIDRLLGAGAVQCRMSGISESTHCMSMLARKIDYDCGRGVALLHEGTLETVLLSSDGAIRTPMAFPCLALIGSGVC